MAKIVLFLFFLVGPVASVGANNSIGHVVLLSFDGLRPDAITAWGPKNLPNFYKLLNEGAFTLNARCDTDVSVTLPNHTCMLTSRGVNGAKGHHLSSNNTGPFTIDQFNDQHISSIFDVLRANGMTSAMDASKLKFNIFSASYPIDEVHLTGEDDALTIANALKQLYRDQAPAFIFVHLAGLDLVGHHDGWSVEPSSAYMQQMLRMDGYLGELIKAIRDQEQRGRLTALIVTSDHGGTNNGHSDAGNQANYTIPFIVWASGLTKGQDLYAINKTSRQDPGEGRVNYARPGQPIRNGEAANVALHLLGLGCVPGSHIGCKPALNLN